MEDNNKYTFSVINFEANKPPKMIEVKSKDYIIFGDDKEYYNNYPQYLLDNRKQSITHNAICNGKVSFVVGNGLEVQKFNTPQDLAGAKACIRSINKYEDADDLNRKLTEDLIVFGGFFVQPVESRGKETGGYYHLPFQNLRKSKSEDGLWYYTSDWSCRKPEQNDDFEMFYEFEGEFQNGKKYLLEYKEYRAGDEVYALPDYIGANASIEMEWRMQDFLLNNVKNGFSAGFLINFYNGRPTEDEQRFIEKKIKDKFTGNHNGGSFVLNFNDTESKSAEIVPIPTNGNDDRFTLLKEQVRDNLFIAHEVTSPMLFGVRVAGTLGGRTELLEAFELFQNGYINNKQRILEKFWCDALYFKGIDAKLEIVETTPLQHKLPEEVVISVMTQNEIREKAGLDPLDNNEGFKTGFSKSQDDLFIEHFANCGIEDSQLEFVYKKGLYAESIEDAMKFEEVTTFENSVLSMLKDNPSLPPVEIAKALNSTPEAVAEAIQSLEAEGYLELTDTEIKVTEEGLENAEEDEFLVVYKYEVRPDAPPLKTESRPFCKAMETFSKTRSWTIEDIKRMRNGQGSDVFVFRGGWYFNPKTKKRTRYCRHRWTQNIVRIKK